VSVVPAPGHTAGGQRSRRQRHRAASDLLARLVRPGDAVRQRRWPAFRRRPPHGEGAALAQVLRPRRGAARLDGRRHEFEAHQIFDIGYPSTSGVVSTVVTRNMRSVTRLTDIVFEQATPLSSARNHVDPSRPTAKPLMRHLLQAARRRPIAFGDAKRRAQGRRSRRSACVSFTWPVGAGSSRGLRAMHRPRSVGAPARRHPRHRRARERLPIRKREGAVLRAGNG
jgi:hypothetical protein